MIRNVQAQGLVQDNDPGCDVWDSVEVSNRVHFQDVRVCLVLPF